MESRYIEGASYNQTAGRVRFVVCGDCEPPQACKARNSLPNRKTVGLCGGVAGANIILGGIEAVKLSVKAKLATVGVATIIGIGRGGVVYHHAFESNPVEVNEQAVSAAKVVTGDSSTKVVDRIDTTSDNRTPVPKKGEANRFEMSADDSS